MWHDKRQSNNHSQPLYCGLLYLLLKKDYEVMRLARKKVVSKDELWDAADTIEWVLQAVDFRYKDLQGTVSMTQPYAAII